MSFTQYTPFVIDNAKLGRSSPTSFVAIIKGNDPRFMDVAHGGRVAAPYDLRPFSDIGVTPLVYKLMKYNGAAGTFEMRVACAPSPTAPTPINVFYGDPSLTVDGSGLPWNDGHRRFVSPLGDGTTLDLNDYSGNGFNLANAGWSTPVTAVAGPVTGAANVGRNNEYVGRMLESPSLGAMSTQTLAAWVKVLSVGGNASGYANLFTTGYVATPPNAQTTWPHDVVCAVLKDDGTLYGCIMDSGSGPTYAGGSALSVGTWYRVVVAWDGTHINLYLNGAPAGSVAHSPVSMNPPVFSVSGQMQPGAAFSDVVIAEPEVTDLVWSADQVTADFNSQSDPATFAVMGSEVDLGDGGDIGDIGPSVALINWWRDLYDI